jgi:hypothetical protein
LPIVETDLKPAAIGVCLAPTAVPSLTGHVVLAGIFKTDTVFNLPWKIWIAGYHFGTGIPLFLLNR